jgi:putative endonuclease
MGGPERRRAAQRWGRRAEWIAAWWLRLKGYRVLARDFRVPPGEIDLVVRRGRVLALVEVKARASLRAAGDAIEARQRQRIAHAAEIFLRRYPHLAGLDRRFDAILIVPGHWPCHIEDAWRLD